jgi:A/G-specific adenine glycosylase
LDAIMTDPRDRQTQATLWARAEEILPTKRVGDFNSAMMELGATVCTPRGPKCLSCPVQSHCEALVKGLQEKIPAPRTAKPTPLEHRWTFCIRDDQARYLIEQRPPRGRWAGLWQFVTFEADESKSPAKALFAHCAVRTTQPARIGQVTHALTHRRYQFDVFSCDLTSAPAVGKRRWTTLSGLDSYPLSRPQLRIAAMLNGTSSPACRVCRTS